MPAGAVALSVRVQAHRCEDRVAEDADGYDADDDDSGLQQQRRGDERRLLIGRPAPARRQDSVYKSVLIVTIERERMCERVREILRSNDYASVAPILYTIYILYKQKMKLWKNNNDGLFYFL